MSGRYNDQWARQVEKGFQNAVARTMPRREFLLQLEKLGLRCVGQRGACEVWETSDGKMVAVPLSAVLSASLRADILYRLRELNHPNTA